MQVAQCVKIKVRQLSFAYGDHTVLKDLTFDVQANTVTAVVGPSGQGKSTLLTVFNRLWEDIPHARLAGTVRIRLSGNERDIYHRACSLTELRRQVGMVFQTPNPLPMSIYKNVAFPLKLVGGSTRSQTRDRVKRTLRQAFLWDEVKDRLKDDARALSGGQQQRLCMARALVLNPEVLLLDEPTSSLDPAATETIEQLILSLKTACTIVMVSHDMAQVERVADQWIALREGRIVAD
ncbi:phosphate ABC transporter ATP-binding protein [Desulfosarcina ovata]|uniref:Phosphate import ATP-binding protein PstB n=1 Tax=Desulfosarcina ovata subsp. ovata TaxID=2752305 RepID=A0A5K8ADF8_9BACT|nr:phosphate ABC transporter ATP-binding protein [Desulfosarcina ovata]BBO90655.1 phosphate import ATP-binding protein PstB [Desulfosarcina ovata subsp. ovata]